MEVSQAKPVIQIAARERGPGPGRYALPVLTGYKGHDPTKKRAASYSMNGRIMNKMFENNNSPGPAYTVPSLLTRKGIDGSPCYSMLARQKELNTFKTPGPGSYSPEKVHPQGEKNAPAYSMGSRTKFKKSDSTPSPNSYTLPPMVGEKVYTRISAPSVSMTGRQATGGFSEDLAKTPGPGRYNVTDPNMVRDCAPKYSMKSRNHMPGDATQKPGPGAHSPEKVYISKKQYPSYSLGIRHSEFVTPLITDVQD